MADTPSGESCISSTSEPHQSSEKQGVENESEESGCLKKERNIFAESRLKYVNQGVTRSCENNPSVCKSTVLRPSQLNGNFGNSICSQKSPFLLNPSKLNPFAKPSNDENSETAEQKESHKESKPNSSTPKFIPLLQNGSKAEHTIKTIASTASTSSVTQSSNFIFGQNIQDRVIADNKSQDIKTTSCLNSNGTSDMLFSSALKETISDNSPISKTQVNKSLSESAREYEEARAVKRKYDEVEVKTGEEGETNVLQIMCKLFAFDKTAGGSWQERGRGILRLNDLEADNATSGSHSRLVFRTSGSFRVVLNTKIWGEMTIQRASDKSIRLTAFDSSGEIKVFLLTGSPEDIKQLHKHLEVRVKKEMEKHKSQKVEDASENTPKTKESTTELKSDN